MESVSLLVCWSVGLLVYWSLEGKCVIWVKAQVALFYKEFNTSEPMLLDPLSV